MDRVYAILVGGLLPAFAFGVAAIFQKGAMLHGVGPGTYMVYDGLVLICAGLVLRTLLGESSWMSPGVPMALLAGLLFAVAIGGLNFALQHFGAPISLLAPITVISTLVTVVLGFVVFREHLEADALRLLGGAICVVAGAALVATS